MVWHCLVEISKAWMAAFVAPRWRCPYQWELPTLCALMHLHTITGTGFRTVCWQQARLLMLLLKCILLEYTDHNKQGLTPCFIKIRTGLGQNVLPVTQSNKENKQKRCIIPESFKIQRQDICSFYCCCLLSTTSCCVQLHFQLHFSKKLNWKSSGIGICAVIMHLVQVTVHSQVTSYFSKVALHSSSYSVYPGG